MTGPQDGNQQRAAEVLPDSVPAYYRGPAERAIAAALAAAEARGRAEVAAMVQILADIYEAATGYAPHTATYTVAKALRALIADLPTPAEQAGDAR